MSVSSMYSTMNFKSLFSSEYEAQFMTKICTTSTIQDGLDSFNCVIAYKNLNHDLIYANKKTLDYTGHHNVRDIIGKKDTDLIWQDFSHIYHKQEEDALDGKIYSALHPGKDVEGRDFLFFNRKYPWINEKKDVIGVICHSVEIENPSLVTLCQVLKKTVVHHTTGIHFIHKKLIDIELTQREEECLFYIVRGKSAKMIGKILNISPRTVEGYIESLKHKLNCTNKTDLVDAAIRTGFIDIIPNSLLLPKLKVSLEE